MKGRITRWIVSCALALTAVPALAAAQTVSGEIRGTVRDSSGGVLPGVTVEASSPVLIEKARTVVSSGTGQYAIEDLRPGTYTVTFSLSGFTTVKREGIQLAGSFIATINADLRVGGVAETIVVSGEAPIVDVTSARNEVFSGALAPAPAGQFAARARRRAEAAGRAPQQRSTWKQVICPSARTSTRLIVGYLTRPFVAVCA